MRPSRVGKPPRSRTLRHASQCKWRGSVAMTILQPMGQGIVALAASERTVLFLALKWPRLDGAPRVDRPLEAPAIEPDRPALDGVGPQVRLRPRVFGEPRPHRVLRLRFDHQHDAMLVRERSAQHDEAVSDQLIHEARVRGPVGLPFHRPRWIPLRAGPALLDMDGRTGRPRYPVAD